MQILDSSVWIAWLNKDDSQQAKAQALFKKIERPILLPEYVLLEVCTVLAMRISKQTADQFIEAVTDNRDVIILKSDETFFANLLTYFQSHEHKGLSFVDVALLFLAKDYPVLTFDTALRKALDRR